MSRELASVTDVPRLPERPADAHKGTFGTVVVVGGSPGMIGAPALCATAAFRGGAGLVKIAAPREVLSHVLTIEPSATGIPLDGEADRRQTQLDRVDGERQAVLAVGPGLGQSDDLVRLVNLLLSSGRPIVLDADGLNLLARMERRLPSRGMPLVLTPHPGEFARLAQPMGISYSATDPEQRPAAAAALADAYGATVVLKGRHTVVTDGQRLFVNGTGNPALATAGSGDVLTGLIAALIAQKMPPMEAAMLAAYLHGFAADLWARQHGPCSMLASDLTRLLPAAMQQLRTASQSVG